MPSGPDRCPLVLDLVLVPLTRTDAPHVVVITPAAMLGAEIYVL
jgi:hypothetical protein